MQEDEDIDIWESDISENKSAEISMDKLNTYMHINLKQVSKEDHKTTYIKTRYRKCTIEDFNRNMEKHVYDQTSRQCDEAKFEKKRLLNRANHFNHRPDKIFFTKVITNSRRKQQRQQQNADQQR